MQPFAALSIEADSSVVVPTGDDGERFHRPGRLGFETACKTGFAHPVEEVPASAALSEGYTPCRLPDCFGDPGRGAESRAEDTDDTPQEAEDE
jgi:hypothetical protein